MPALIEGTKGFAVFYLLPLQVGLTVYDRHIFLNRSCCNDYCRVR